MAIDREKVSLIRRELDLADPQALDYFGVSPQRRLTRVARAIAAQDSVSVVSKTDETLRDAISLLGHKPTKWLDPFLHMVAIFPLKTPEQRYARIGARLAKCLLSLQQQKTIFEVWQKEVGDIADDLRSYILVGEMMARDLGDHPQLGRLKNRVSDLETSITIADLVGKSLQQRQTNYRVLVDQLVALMGNGASAWYVQRAQMRSLGQEGFRKLQALAQACQQADTAWQDSMPDDGE